jgi:hypothetical protein
MESDEHRFQIVFHRLPFWSIHGTAKVVRKHWPLKKMNSDNCSSSLSLVLEDDDAFGCVLHERLPKMESDERPVYCGVNIAFHFCDTLIVYARPSAQKFLRHGERSLLPRLFTGLSNLVLFFVFLRDLV